MTKRKILIAILLVAVCLGIFFLVISKNRNDDYTLYGNVDIRDVNLAFRVSGKIEELFVEEGDQVKAGQILARLDTSIYEKNSTVLKSKLISQNANLAKFKTGFRPQEIAQAQQAVNEKDAAYQRQKLIFDRFEILRSEGAVSQQEYDDKLAALNQAKALLNSAQANLNLQNQGFRKEDISLAQAQSSSAQASYELAQIQLEDTKLFSPSNGTILSRVREVGSIVNTGETIYTLALDKPVWVRTHINEKYLGLIHPGMAVNVHTDSRPNKPYQGLIGYISPQAEFTPKNVETTELRTDLVYRLRVNIEKPDQFLRQGMPVTIKIKLNEEN